MITIKNSTIVGYTTTEDGYKPIQRISGFCLSTDTKPTGDLIGNGSDLLEMDTGKVCFYDAEGVQWEEF